MLPASGSGAETLAVDRRAGESGRSGQTKQITFSRPTSSQHVFKVPQVRQDGVFRSAVGFGGFLMQPLAKSAEMPYAEVAHSWRNMATSCRVVTCSRLKPWIPLPQLEGLGK
ncbi:hypothetical protein FQN60_008686, partial [Etheostoma spectabile]